MKPKNKKSLNFSVETIFVLFSTIFFTRFHLSISICSSYSFRLQFPFVFHRLQSLQLLLPAHPCLSTFSGFSIPRISPLPFLFLTSAVFASFRPLQFWILTTWPLFLPFPSLPVSASQLPPQCSFLAFASSVFLVLSSLISRAFLPDSGTWLRCLFPFALPCFTPTAVPQVLTFCFRLWYFPFPFLFLSSVSVPLPATQPSVSSFPFLPVSASQRLPQCSSSTFVSYVFPVLSSLISHAFLPRFSYLAF